ncbi:unnamed protein product [Sphagnum balticum]
MMPVSIGIDQAAAAMTGNATNSPLRQLPAEPLMKNNVVGIWVLKPFSLSSLVPLSFLFLVALLGAS